jgi:hypothetical protein
MLGARGLLPRLRWRLGGRLAGTAVHRPPRAATPHSSHTLRPTKLLGRSADQQLVEIGRYHAWVGVLPEGLCRRVCHALRTLWVLQRAQQHLS